MEALQARVAVLVGFAVLAIASKQIGIHAARLRLPLISGFLLTGVLIGPYALGFLDADSVEGLHFVVDVALGVIGLAAGSELHLPDIVRRLRSIASLTAGLVVTTFVAGTLAVFALSNSIPFLSDLPTGSRLAASVLTGSILVARSPSSAIAIVKELRARGLFTQTALGVTVIMDAVVIILFAFGSELGSALDSGFHVSYGFVGLLVLEILLSLFAGLVVWRVLGFVLARRWPMALKSILVVGAGYGTFVLGAHFREWTSHAWGHEVLLEPLLICMLGGLLVTNASPHRAELARILHDTGPPVYVTFFTLTGATLELDVLARAWPVALALFAVRLAAIGAGSWLGASIGNADGRHRRVLWMAFVTQAGVGIGLAQELASEFPYGVRRRLGSVTRCSCMACGASKS